MSTETPIQVDPDECEILEEYARTDGHRDWGRSGTWLYPGEMIIQVSGETARKVKEAIMSRMGNTNAEAPSR